ncbi:flagellar motor stator protein MotA [Cohaesibacter celericrescens]|uniref:Flagellar motor stator protein MotA n=1 Tax=Cohaesibacter celericrescens TaxID=2067669 RepID=A0A2N5XLY4_9HYPH|nr:flagellar motor stator protein MotA [Cohaesibacter celericrescens]PLW75502.1 flagellar motor stator protein MotA [Cohaesibacter celericrescens]PLW78909.1 flagellar motor stator protein MotA [Cohaesibacter celericrescens]
MSVFLGLTISLVSLLGGFAAMGGHVAVLFQPWEFLIVFGVALGTFVLANPLKTVKDTGQSIGEALSNSVPKKTDYLDVLGLLYTLMRELRAKGRNDIEPHIEEPENSAIFAAYPSILRNIALRDFICDYFRLLIVSNARPHEIEALMDEELMTRMRDQMKPYLALSAQAESLPAIGIVAAVLGVIKAMGAIDQSPAILGGLIAAALVGTFAGIFGAYALVGPLANKVKTIREKRSRHYVIVKQTLLAFMNGAAPQIALEHGRKTISELDRPSIDEVENQTMNAGPISSSDGSVHEFAQKGAA